MKVWIVVDYYVDEGYAKPEAAYDNFAAALKHTQQGRYEDPCIVGLEVLSEPKLKVEQPLPGDDGSVVDPDR